MLPILQQQPRGNSPMSGEHHVQRFLEDERPLLPSLCICVGIVNASASLGNHDHASSPPYLPYLPAVTVAMRDLHPVLKQAVMATIIMQAFMQQATRPTPLRSSSSASSPPDLHLPDQAAVTGPQQGSASPPELPAEQHRAIPSVIRDSACASEGVVGPVPAKRRSSVTTVDLGGPEGPLPFVSVPATPKGKVPPPCCSQAYPEVCVYVYVCLVNACSQPRCLSNLCAPLSYKKFPAEKFSAAALPSNLRCPAWDSGAFVLSVSIPPMLVHLCYEALFETLY
eukprot:1159268-Pelagomonas_calceolata.AAC.11